MSDFEKALEDAWLKYTYRFDMGNKNSHEEGARWAQAWCDYEWDAMKQDRDMFQAEVSRLREALELIDELVPPIENALKYMQNYGERGDFEVALEKIKAFKDGVNE